MRPQHHKSMPRPSLDFRPQSCGLAGNNDDRLTSTTPTPSSANEVFITIAWLESQLYTTTSTSQILSFLIDQPQPSLLPTDLTPPTPGHDVPLPLPLLRDSNPDPRPRRLRGQPALRKILHATAPRARRRAHTRSLRLPERAESVRERPTGENGKADQRRDSV
jgi:hypothetical protein